MIVTFSPAGAEGASGAGVDGFFRNVAIPVVEGEPPPRPREPEDPEALARAGMQYGIEIVGPPPTLDD